MRQRFLPAMTAGAMALAKPTLSPAAVALEAFIRALTDRNPATRYLAGRDARMLNLLRHLPNRTQDRPLMSGLGLNERLFDKLRVSEHVAPRGEQRAPRAGTGT